MRSGDFSWTTGGDNHKLQGAAQSPHNTRRTTRSDAWHDSFSVTKIPTKCKQKSPRFRAKTLVYSVE